MALHSFYRGCRLLYGLAGRHECRFVSFDARIDPANVNGAQAKHWLTLQR